MSEWYVVVQLVVLWVVPSYSALLSFHTVTSQINTEPCTSFSPIQQHDACSMLDYVINVILIVRHWETPSSSMPSKLSGKSTFLVFLFLVWLFMLRRRRVYMLEPCKPTSFANQYTPYPNLNRPQQQSLEHLVNNHCCHFGVDLMPIAYGFKLSPSIIHA